MNRLFRAQRLSPKLFCAAAFLSATVLSSPVSAQLDPFVQAVAIAASENDVISAFYRDRNYAPVWTGEGDAARRNALLSVLAHASDHGLPEQMFDPAPLVQAFHDAQTEGDRGRLEIRLTEVFLAYARAMQSGVLNPRKIDVNMVREVRETDPAAMLAGIVSSEPGAFLHGLAPNAPEYAQLVKAKIGLDRTIAAGGWGPRVPATTLRPGQSGDAVIALRDRLMRMGYLGRSFSADYDAALQRAVQDFQIDHGLDPDGIASESTLAEINVSAEDRLKSVLVALERQRWMDFDKGDRHIWVNLTDFSAKIIDHGKVTFATRSVIGKNTPDQRTPEFSDVMEYMVINPSWNVPRSITVKEYLPLMKRNPGAAGHLKLIDSRGRVVNRSAVNFASYNERNFPYSMRQPPSDSNALGLVKFMFPNPYNIYLHDTPSKSLFDHEVRAFSHGCVRLGQPFEFAYALLAAQTEDPKGLFHGHLNTGQETTVRLDDPVPVHLVYFTAYPTAKGRISYRRDVYGRDATIFDALQSAGVALTRVDG
ncbi:murein L,D-transpeptidase [Aliigemmobacter aestuarii]|uniref:Murein L,D-transpeptidase n=1 Tax=Aliigemmobacter aestuarii TaxID=1445661 RepID=A0A4S3MLW6_9RHOB|nr:L,D-transpeptidase family protein [Gemmobacter aestuarii]THD83107.1 murein L,D-transpeptidase [Gemmobacter aestuarii]